MSEVELLDAPELVAPGEVRPLPQHLVDKRATLFKAGTPANTQRTYRGVERRFDDWCAEVGQQAFPLTEDSLTGYITHLASTNCTPATLGLTVTVLTSRERVLGDRLVPPSWLEACALMIRGHAAERSPKEGETKALPLTRDHLVQYATTCETQGWRTVLRGKRDALLISLGYSLALRESELCGLRVGDVQDLGDSLKVVIRTSKTDKMSVGREREIPQGSFAPLEPVTLFQDYIAALREVGATVEPGDPLFRGITRHGKPFAPQTVTVERLGKVGTRTFGGLNVRLVDEILRSFCRRGLMPEAMVALVSGHSLRAGYATTCAWDATIPQAIWSEWGGWEPTSRVPALYVRDAQLKKECPLLRIGL